MADATNEQIIDYFQVKDAPTRRQLHIFIKAMCEEARGAEVEAILLGMDFAPCVAREWGTESKRRAFMLQRSMRRKYRKDTSAYGKRGQADRSIIATTLYGDRRAEFHATKGRRNYAIPVISQ